MKVFSEAVNDIEHKIGKYGLYTIENGEVVVSSPQHVLCIIYPIDIEKLIKICETNNLKVIHFTDNVYLDFDVDMDLHNLTYIFDKNINEWCLCKRQGMQTISNGTLKVSDDLVYLREGNFSSNVTTFKNLNIECNLLRCGQIEIPILENSTINTKSIDVRLDLYKSRKSQILTQLGLENIKASEDARKYLKERRLDICDNVKITLNEGSFEFTGNNYYEDLRPIKDLYTTSYEFQEACMHKRTY